MGFLDIWTIATGAASIVSLLLAMSEKFPEWRKYVVPSGFLLAGFTLGRMSIGALPGAKESMQDPRFVGIVVIITLIFLMLYIFLRAMIKRKQDYYAYFVVFMVLLIGIPQVMDKYFDAFPAVPKEDYLLLAKSKEKNNDIAGAIRYLEKYKAMTKDKALKSQVEETIARLQKAELGGANGKK
jgi:hypothetical protein